MVDQRPHGLCCRDLDEALGMHQRPPQPGTRRTPACPPQHLRPHVGRRDAVSGLPGRSLDQCAGESAEQHRYAPTTKGRSKAWAKVALGVLLPLLVIGGGVWGWYAFVQSKYFVGESNDLVTVFRGVPDTLAGIRLNTPLEVHNTHVSDLPLFYQEQVKSSIVVPDLAAAENTTEQLRVLAERCIAQRKARAEATATPTPSPTLSTSPTSSPSPSGTPREPSGSPSATSPSPSPSPSADTPKAPEDC